jgi:hypothetical protein
MRRAPFALVVAACVFSLVGGCAEAHLQPLAFREWQAGPAKDDPKDAAVVVLAHRERYLVVQRPNAPAYMEIQTYKAMKVLSEDGFEEAAAHVFVPSKGRLQDLRARTISANGVHDVDVSTVLADSFALAGEEGATRSFQFPRVEVGSILESTSVIRREGAWWSFSGTPVQKYPVKTWELEIVLDKFATPDLFLDNAKVPIDYTKDPDGTQHIRLTLKDIAASSKEPLRPDNSELHPRWMYRTIEWRFPRYVQKGVSSWSRALGYPFHKIVVEHEGVDGLPVLVGADACRGDARCLIEAAVRQTRNDLVLTAFNDDLEVRKVSELVATRTATNHEKAVYLWALLKAAGVDARLAASARRNTARIHESFPSSAPFNHTLVLAPGDLWIDPSCEHCAVGELPDWSRDTRAVPLSVRGGEYGDELFSEGFVDVKGRAAPISDRIRRFDVVVRENGDVDVVAEEEARGGDATDIHIEARTWTKKDAEEASLRIAKGRSQAGRSVEATPWTCDRAKGVCRWRHVFRLPGWATVDASTGHLVVPLEIMSVQREHWFAKKERRLPVVILENYALTETLRLTPPSGYTVDVAGLPVGEGRAEGYTAAVKVAHEGQTLVVTRTDTLQAGRHPAAHWAKLHDASATFRSARTFAVRAVPATTTSSTAASATSPKTP